MKKLWLVKYELHQIIVLANDFESCVNLIRDRFSIIDLTEVEYQFLMDADGAMFKETIVFEFYG